MAALVARETPDRSVVIFAMSAAEWIGDRLVRLRGKRPSALTERDVAEEIRQLEDTLAKMQEAAPAP